MRKYSSHLRLIPAIAALALTQLACQREPDRPAPLAEAYAGPISTNIRAELSPASKAVATVKHGEKLDVLQVRRRFVRVRTEKGIEGWTDARNLLNDSQMQALRDFSKAASHLPSQGKATVYSTLNIHSEPARSSPSIYQITEGAPVDVLAHKIAPRSGAATPVQVFTIPKPPPPPRKTKKKEESESKIPPPPKGAAPKLPENWLELSKSYPAEGDEKDEEEEAKKEEKKGPPPKPVVMEDWSLVRTKDGKAGWALTRMLTMSIPDEVAQYAEGNRIAAYFSLGTIEDSEQRTKHHWLWTTMSQGPQPFDFDSFRVFIWNARRHRYETAYIERRIVGYYPIDVNKGPPTTFSLLLENQDGKIMKHTFRFEGYRAYKVGEAEAQRPPELTVSSAVPPPTTQSKPEEAKPSMLDRIKGLTKRDKT